MENNSRRRRLFDRINLFIRSNRSELHFKKHWKIEFQVWDEFTRQKAEALSLRPRSCLASNFELALVCLSAPLDLGFYDSNMQNKISGGSSSKQTQTTTGIKTANNLQNWHIKYIYIYIIAFRKNTRPLEFCFDAFRGSHRFIGGPCSSHTVRNPTAEWSECTYD